MLSPQNFSQRNMRRYALVEKIENRDQGKRAANQKDEQFEFRQHCSQDSSQHRDANTVNFHQTYITY
jgi:hypothetical protein